SRRGKSTEKSVLGGGFFIILLSVGILVGVYYWVDYLYRDKTIKKAEIIPETGIPEDLSHILLLNEESASRQKLNSVVMLGFHQPSRLLIVSYFPPDSSLDKKRSLEHYYGQGGADSILREFKKSFGLNFSYVTVNRNFYERLSRNVEPVYIYMKNNQDLVFADKYLLRSAKDKNIYSLSGENLSRYLLFDNKWRNDYINYIKRVRMLHAVKSFLVSGRAITDKTGNLKPGFDRARAGGWTLSHDLTQKESSRLIRALRGLKQENIISYPFRFKRHRQYLEVRPESRRYLQLISFIKTRYRQKVSFTPKHYLEIVRALGQAHKENPIRLKIIDRSGRGYQYTSQSFRGFFELLNLKIVNYQDGVESLKESYIVNSNHNIEMSSYVQGALRVGRAYNSAHKARAYHDVLLIMGKDFPKISSSEQP
ncbi:MAG: hypothetical protein OEZ36_06345, partial [Spirochaetota bacterium]|nr:hypothetical protein [Spirochaetota bacterium]